MDYKVKYPEMIINKSNGTTYGEVYLSKLCEHTFLSLWSYPNIYRDQGKFDVDNQKKGDSKELTDLLVIFENHIIIFSDKVCNFGDEQKDLLTNWRRWYKKTVYKSAKQIYGAERWLFEYPERVYLDAECSNPFPIKIPSKEDAIVHRIVVAHGASEACKKHFQGGSGSMVIDTNVVGHEHYNESCKPFTIGVVEPIKGFIHVLDDITLDILLKELDTVSDFVGYLMQKEQLIENNITLIVNGEEDLLGHYLSTLSGQDHAFIPDDVENGFSIINVEEGYWNDFNERPERKEQIRADKVSYLWDEILERFLYHTMSGTSDVMSKANINKFEALYRFLAKEKRVKRRFLSEIILDAIDTWEGRVCFRRTILPAQEGDPCYLFLFFSHDFSTKNDEEYRNIRRELLECYILSLKKRESHLRDIIGIAMEPNKNKPSSEDIIYLDGRIWNSEDIKSADEAEEYLENAGILSQSRNMFSSHVQEYPDSKERKLKNRIKGKKRNKPCPCGSGKKYKNCCGRIF